MKSLVAVSGQFSVRIGGFIEPYLLGLDTNSNNKSPCGYWILFTLAEM